ncbi:MAG: DUF5103 domain-containing protein [Pedobacter sp.]|nr:MAG: DUF5103 domain-containing protein [Pedobacter sp.]
MNKWIAVLGLWVLSFGALAQKTADFFENKETSENLKSIQLFPVKQEQGLPKIQLHSNDQLYFSFDDLEGGFKSYRYSIEHCTSDWKSSGLNKIFYADGFSDELLNNYSYSSKTYQKYTHYNLIFPNNAIKPKISGNYILKVFLEEEPNKVLIYRRFYVVEPKASIFPKVEASAQVSNRKTHQKLNIQVNLSQSINNPQQDIKLHIYQNNIPYTLNKNLKPNQIKGNQLIYNGINQAEFLGTNEFRKFDIRSMRSYGANVKNIEINAGFEVILFTDKPNTSQKYSIQPDENGLFFIRNNDLNQTSGAFNPSDLSNQTESDYALVKFTLQDPFQLNFNNIGNAQTAKIYVVGGFNNFQLHASNQLKFNPITKLYQISLPFKQGLYDYKYVIQQDTNHGVPVDLDGNFMETQNSYQLFLYHKKPGARYEELWAIQEIKN